MPEPLFAGRPATLLGKRGWHMCFPVNFTKFLRTPFLTEHFLLLLLALRTILLATEGVVPRRCFAKYCSNSKGASARRLPHF